MEVKVERKIGRKNPNKFLLLGLFFVAILTMAIHVFTVNAANPPTIVTYQGKVLANGVAATSTLSMKFVLYSAVSGGSPLYSLSGSTSSPSAVSVTPSSGLFTIDLGGSGYNALDPEIFKNNGSVYLEITIGSETLSPRKQIGAAPYAFNAKYLDGVAATATPQSSVYIPLADSNGGFNFSNITSTLLRVTGNSNLSTTTISYLNLNGGSLTGVTGDISQWTNNTGYITTSTGLTTANFASANISQWTNNAGYLTSYTESDPIWLAASSSYAKLSANNTFTGTNNFSTTTQSVFRLGTSATSGYVLTTDANGYGTWQVASSTGGGLSGGLANTLPYWTSASALSTTSLYWDNVNGRFGVNENSPDARLVVNNGIIEDNTSSTQPVYYENLFKAGVKYEDAIIGSAYVGGLGLASSSFDLRNGGGFPNSIGLAGLATTLGSYGIIGIGENGANAGYFLSTDIDGQALNVRNVSPNGYAIFSGTGLNYFGGGSTFYSTSTFSNDILFNGVDKAIITTGSNGNGWYSAGSLALSPNGAGNRALLYNSLFAMGVSGLDINSGDYDSSMLEIDYNGNITTSGTLRVYGASTFSTTTQSVFRLGTSATSGYVLTTDANGYGTWQVASSTGGGLSGGLANTLPYWTSASALSTTSLYWDNVNGRLGVGTTTPAFALDVNGNINLGASNYLAVGSNRILSVAGTQNVFLGMSTAAGGSSGLNNTFIGYAAGNVSGGGNSNTLLGAFAGGSSVNGSYNTLVGTYAGQNNSGTYNVFLGYSAGMNETGSNKLYISNSNTTTPLIYGDFSNNYLAFNNKISINNGTTTPSYNLDVNGTIRATGTSTLATTTVSGRLGVGTTTPSELIHVTGGNILHTASGNPTLKGALDTTMAYKVYASGKYAYVADGSTGLQIVDISNPALPVLVSTYDTPDTAYGVFISGRYAYVADFDTLQIIDISNPTNPSFVGSYNTGQATGVYVSGKYAYVSDHADGFKIIDIANPTNPSLAYSYDTPGYAWGIYVSGKYAYVADASSLEIFDISNPTSPIWKGTYNTSVYSVRDVYISGKFAYLADGYTGLQIVDISSSTNPVSVGIYDTSGQVSGVVVSGKYAYLADGASGLQIVDISSSTNPVFVGAYNTDGGALTVYVSGKYAYLADGASGLQIIDINGIETPAMYAGNIQSSDLTITENVDVGNNIYIRNGLNVGLGGILSNGAISSMATNSINYFAGNVSVSGTAVFATTTQMAFRLGTSATAGYVLTADADGYGTWQANGVSGLSGGLANTISYWTGGNSLSTTSLYWDNANGRLGIGTSTPQFKLDVWGDLRVLNTSTLATTTISNLSVSNLASGSIVFASSSGLLSTTSSLYWDNTNGRLGIGTNVPSSTLHLAGGIFTHSAGNPVLAGYVGVGTSPENVFVSGKYAYVTDLNDSNLKVIDISNPAVPTVVGSITDSATTALNLPRGVFVSGKYAYVTSFGEDGVEILDVSNHATPTHVGAIFDDGTTYLNGANKIYVSGKYAYVLSHYDNSLTILDVSDPTHPVQTGYIIDNASTTFNGPQDFYVSDKYAYVVGDSDGLEIIDISDPTNPVHAGSLADSAGTYLNGASSISVQGRYAYIASTEGVEIVDISNPYIPTHVKSFVPNTDTNRTIQVSGKYAYVVGGTGVVVLGSISVYDISSSTNPFQVARVSENDSCQGVESPVDLFIAGKYAYILNNQDTNNLAILDLSGMDSPAASIGSLSVTDLQVYNNINTANSLIVGSGLNVGVGGIFSNGAISSMATTSANYFAGNLAVGTTTPLGAFDVYHKFVVDSSGNVSASGTFSMNGTTTNTLSFATTTKFTSNIANASTATAFVFNAANFATSSGADRYLLSLRSNNTAVFSVSAGGEVHALGNLNANSATVGTPGSPGDLAERVDIAVDDNVEAGDVLVVDSDRPDTYRRSSESYEQAVAGVVSTNPTIVVGYGKTEYTAVMAMVGRVPVKVTNENGQIKRGDLLVSASTTGYAMKYDSNKDDNGKMVGIVGVALESLSGDSGKVMALIRTGWASSRNATIASLSQNIQALALAQGMDLNSGSMNLGVENQSGQLGYSGGNFNLQGNLILNVKAINGLDGKWAIDSDGRFITRIDTSVGKKDMYAMQSPEAEFVFSSSSQLISGEAIVVFDQATQEIIDAGQPLKVSITLTSGEASGIYVSEKSATGFKAKELNNGRSSATFDWMVVAKRKINNDNQTIVEPSSDIAANPIPEVASTTPEVISTTSSTPTPEPESVPVLEPVVTPEPESVPVLEPVVTPEPSPFSEPVSNPAPEPTPEAVPEIIVPQS